MSNTTSLRERFLEKARASRTETVTPDFLGEPIELTQLTLAERRDLLVNAVGDNDEQDAALLQAQVIIATARDPETHAPVFTAGDRDMLLGLPAVTLDELSHRALILNGLMVVAAQAAAEKN